MALPSVRRDGETNGLKKTSPRRQEKPLLRKHRPVPQTDTGRQGENPKMSERNAVKELGKIAP